MPGAPLRRDEALQPAQRVLLLLSLIHTYMCIRDSALAAAMAVVYLSMRYAGAIHRVLREGVTTLVSRIAGLLCAAIAVQMMADGVIGFVRTI